MIVKYLFFYSLSALFFLLCFIFSGLVVLTNNSGVVFAPSAAMSLNTLVAVIFVGFSLYKFRFKSWDKCLGIFAWVGLTIGTCGIINILLVDPLSKGGPLFMPWILSLIALFYYRNLFFPFQLEGFRLAGNLSIGAGIFLFFKILIMSGGFLSIPFFGEKLGIGESHVGFYNLAVISVLWTSGIIFYYLGISLLSSTIKDENEEHLNIIKENLKLDVTLMNFLEIQNADLYGKSENDVQDIILKKANEIEYNNYKYKKFKNLIEKKKDDSKLISNISGLLDYKNCAVLESSDNIQGP